MPDSTKRPLKVFLCHAHADRDPVRALYSRLRREGIDVWLDKKKLLAGSDWELEIRKAVREADVVVVCLSKQFNQRGFRQKEVRLAIETAMEQPDGEIFIIPARLEECENLENLRKLHWVDLFEDDGFRNLIRALRVRADRIGATLPLRRDARSSISHPKSTKPEQEKTEGVIAAKVELEKAEQEKFEQETAAKADRKIIEQALKGNQVRFVTRKVASKSEKNVVEEKPKDREQKPDEMHLQHSDTSPQVVVVGQDEIYSVPQVTSSQSVIEKNEKIPEAEIESLSELSAPPESLVLETDREQNENITTIGISEKKNHIPSFSLRFVGGVVAGLSILSFVTWGAFRLFINPPISPSSTRIPNPTQVIVIQSAASLTSEPTLTATPSPTKTSIPPTPTLGIGSIMTGKDGMTLLYVPAGKFTMGSDNGAPDEKPVHAVYLDAFWIDQTEVTVRMYYLCVETGECREPTSKGSNTHSSYYSNAKYNNYPVIYVDWNRAKTYCEWVGRRLPTEAEWEKAARGTKENIYPWGNDAPHNNLLNFNAIGDTSEVGEFPKGASPYGVLDMAGNVWEWVNDWYQSNYYDTLGDDAFNPHGPSSGDERVLRGGSWSADGNTVRSALRVKSVPSLRSSAVGFRCAMDATP